MTQPKQKQRRRRGVILTPQGLARLQEAKSEVEYQENRGNRYTLEALSERTGLAVDTLMKLFACEAKVDKQTLKDCFRAFNLVLESNDYYYPDPHPLIDRLSDWEPGPELPEGQVPLNSPFYVERSPIEADSYKAIMQPGALVRIRAPRRMGKSSLLARILDQAGRAGCRCVSLNLQLADKSLFENLDRFLRWFCANVSLGLQLPSRLEDYWDELFGSKISCKLYFEQYLLSEVDQAIVLGLDGVDRLFRYPDLADDFFALLRAWHEEAKNRDIWKKLRLVVVHSSEVYIPLNVNQSPFNVGLPIELPEFTPEQILDLAKRHELDWSDQQVQQLMSLLGGHPYLVRLALYHIWHEDLTLEELLAASPMSADNIYSDHLQRQLWNLQQKNSGLAEALAQVVLAEEPIELDLVQAFKLQSLGLVHLQGNQAFPSCQLYSDYFRDYFSQDRPGN